MTILYIKNEHCTSLDQLKGYFSESLISDCDIYDDLLDYGRYGDLSSWLREIGEIAIADSIDAIDKSIPDSEYMTKLGAVIIGEPITPPQKPSFDQCFKVEDVSVEIAQSEAKCTMKLNILHFVNESYEIRVESNWGTDRIFINPSAHTESSQLSLSFTFYKYRGMTFGKVLVYADNNKLSIPPFRFLPRVYTIKGISFKMIFVEGSTFSMGATKEKGSLHSNEEPAHSVTLSNYYIGETEVTQELWTAVMGCNPSKFSEGNQLPVENVSWNNCLEFIAKLNELTSMQFHLPTEAQWEFAARGGIKSQGYCYSGSNNLDEVGWSMENSNQCTHSVKTKKANELGIYEMSGNVQEWCLDWYDSDYYNYSISNNPSGPNSGIFRVVRGGSWNDTSECSQLTYRKFYSPDFYFGDIGFRLVLNYQ